jgi:hypothetical protein
LFLFTPKWIFIFGPDHLAHAKSIEERSKKGYETTEKEPKNLTKSLVLRHPKMGFYFWSTQIATFKNHWKTAEKEYEITENDPKSFKNP